MNHNSAGNHRTRYQKGTFHLWRSHCILFPGIATVALPPLVDRICDEADYTIPIQRRLCRTFELPPHHTSEDCCGISGSARLRSKRATLLQTTDCWRNIERFHPVTRERRSYVSSFFWGRLEPRTERGRHGPSSSACRPTTTTPCCGEKDIKYRVYVWLVYSDVYDIWCVPPHHWCTVGSLW